MGTCRRAASAKSHEGAVWTSSEHGTIILVPTRELPKIKGPEDRPQTVRLLS